MTDEEFAPIVIGKLLNIGGMLEKKANQLLAPFNLNHQQFSLLFEIDRAGKVNQKTMVNRFELEKAHVSKIIKKLAAANLVAIEILADDRRATWLSITPEGRALVGQCRKVIGEFNRFWYESVDGAKIGGLLDALGELQRVFKKDY